MAKALPPKGFASARLRLWRIPTGTRFGRIHLERHPDPLGFGKAPSRFSDPRRRPAKNRFGVLYLGESLHVCFAEAVLRDRRDGAIGDLPIEESELRSRRYAEVAVADPLEMVDLRGNAAIQMGVPSDVARASDQGPARPWALAFHQHPRQPDGIAYPSRFNGQTNLAVFDRAIAKLTVAATMPLLDAPRLPGVLDEFEVSLV